MTGIRDPYIADLLVGRLAFAKVAGQGDLAVDRLVERVVPYTARYGDARLAVVEALADLVELGLVAHGDPAYGTMTFRIAPAEDEVVSLDDGQWRATARTVAERMVGRCDTEGDEARDDLASLWDAVRVLDLLDRAPGR